MSGARAQCALTRAISFYARHRYAGHGPQGDHGHLYRVEVSVAGAIDAARQHVIDLDALDNLLTEAVSQPLAGRHLNEAIPEFASGEQLPTCEAIAVWCWQQLAPRLPSDTRLQRVRVAEDAGLWADCTGVD
ncbi:MAG: 6-pyruvoyl trahydropterin synthase family protein [Gemmatimonadales bacterium]